MRNSYSDRKTTLASTAIQQQTVDYYLVAINTSNYLDCISVDENINVSGSYLQMTKSVLQCKHFQPIRPLRQIMFKSHIPEYQSDIRPQQ